jgi:hypothetical protein
MSKNVKNGNGMNNSNLLQKDEFNLLNDWNYDLSNETIRRGKTSFKSKVLNDIKREINLISLRKDLKLKRINKKNKKGNIIEVNESRFWKQSIANPNTLLISIKHKGRIIIFNSNNDVNYIMCENDKDKLVSLLENVKSNIESLDENHQLFEINKPIKK